MLYSADTRTVNRKTLFSVFLNNCPVSVRRRNKRQWHILNAIQSPMWQLAGLISFTVDCWSLIGCSEKPGEKCLVFMVRVSALQKHKDFLFNGSPQRMV